MKILKNVKLILTTLILTFFFSCNSDSNSSQTELDGTSRISIRLSDGPGDFTNVFIDIVDILVKVNDESEDDNGWQSLNVEGQIVDLLELTGGKSILLVDDFELPSGTLNQIRLVLGEENSIVIKGEPLPFPLKTPSAQQSGLKLKVDHELEPGFTYNLLLDFDVDKSIVIAGNSENIILKPVMRASTLYASGIIEGIVNPFDFQVMAAVMVEGDTISAYADGTGAFVLNGVPGGTYSVVFTPDPVSAYAVTTVDNVEVVNGEITDMGIVDLDLKVGSIRGTIYNQNVAVTASVMVNDVEKSIGIDAERVFLLIGIPVGTYTVTLTPAPESGLTVKEIVGVVVIQDEVTDIGNITLM